MATSQSDVAVGYANQVMALVQQLRNIRATVSELVTVNANNPLGNFWSALNTTALASDGGVGQADTLGTPVNGHYIDPRLYPAINRLAKNTDLTAALQILVDLSSFCAGTALTANGARPAQIDLVSM